ncbi:MAG: hypothetical protein JW900_05415 [Anaerolineae bacterium]|nr:hypothetical protein [Anaerolineae bacterium]
MRKKSLLVAILMLVIVALACSPTENGDNGGGDTPTAPPPPPTATRAPLPDVLFEDDFSDPSTGWEIDEFDTGTIGYGPGYYYVTTTELGSMMWGQAMRNFSNTIIDVDATQVSAPSNDNNAYGVMCRVQSDSNGYLLRVSGDGYYAVHRIVNDEFEPLVDWTTSTVINMGNATNHLRVVCDGDRLTLIVNGEVLADIRDTTYTSGDIALTATTFEEEGTEIHYDNLVVTEP